jgi:hypothetical protein
LRSVFDGEKSFGSATYIRTFFPTNCARCEFSFFPFFIWIRNRFVRDKEEGEDFALQQWRELGSDSTHHEDDGVLAEPAWVVHAGCFLGRYRADAKKGPTGPTAR